MGKRFSGYVRVSRVSGRDGPSYISPTVQREAIERWAQYHGIEIVEWHVDEDESGGTQRRPGLREAINGVEAGNTDGIACWRLNRFARNVSGAIDDIKRVQAVGGELAFIEEGIDGRGPFGEFLLTVLLAVATLERDNVVAGWETAKRRAVARGAKIGRAPYGFLRQEDGTIVADPVKSEIVKDAFHIAASRGLTAAIENLSQNEPQRVWTSTTVRRLLGNRSYLGENRYGDIVQADAHEALVSRAIWEAAQHPPMIHRGPSSQYPLSGLARCGTCDSPMTGTTGGVPTVRSYRCSSTSPSRVRCKKAAQILATTLEDHIRTQIRPILKRFKAEVGETQADALTLAERTVNEAEAELDAFAGDLTMRRALGNRYHEHLTARVEEVERARETYRDRAKEAQAQTIVWGEEMLDNPQEFSEISRSVLTAIIVSPGRGSADKRIRLILHNMDSSTRISSLDKA